tara:strand:- start:23685 stop:24758 length:1074 start_codon:yes stop_codon:yes gene_type:complete
MTTELFSDRILAWFDQHGRHNLPWQHDITPYRVWLSETMLQQTQVTTVIPYFQKFAEQFPSITDLANAHEDEVLHLWTGLGYYSRARNLHKAAQIVRDNFNGEFPTQFNDIIGLPGIGRSTAGAISAIALNQRYAILDGNVKRVLTRVHTIEGWPGSPTTMKQLWKIAENYTPTERVADYTQAMMDLGATLCKRGKPECECCPVITMCQAHAQNRQREFPHSKPKKQIPERHTTMLILQKSEHEVLLIKRPPTGIWGGLWSFIEADDKTLAQVCQHYGCDMLDTAELPSFRHTFSHFHLDITPIVVSVRHQNHVVAEADTAIWYNLAKPNNVGLAAPVKKLLETLHEHTHDSLHEVK